MKPVITFFTYNRPKHTRLALQSLAACKGASEKKLIIYSDGPKSDQDLEKVQEVRQIARAAQGFKSVELVFRDTNFGSAKSISSGIVQAADDFGSVIVVEDDIICSPYLLTYFETCLERFQETPNIMSICGYSYPSFLMPIPKNYEYDVYFTPRFEPWGWATWKHALDKVDWEVADFESFTSSPSEIRAFKALGEDLPRLLVYQQQEIIDDWVLPFIYSQFKNNFLSVSPVHSLVHNIGHDGSGLHCADTRLFENKLLTDYSVEKIPDNIFVDSRILNGYKRVHGSSLLNRINRRMVDYMLKTEQWFTNGFKSLAR